MNSKTKKSENKISNYLNEEENEKRIKQIESEIKKKKEEKKQRLELIKQSRNKELLKLEIKVMTYNNIKMESMEEI